MLKRTHCRYGQGSENVQNGPKDQNGQFSTMFKMAIMAKRDECAKSGKMAIMAKMIKTAKLAKLSNMAKALNRPKKPKSAKMQ